MPGSLQEFRDILVMKKAVLIMPDFESVVYLLPQQGEMGMVN